MANTKRILNIIIKHIPDTDGDTSWLGEYSDTRESTFSIDRKHSADCQSLSTETVDKLERVNAYLDAQRIILSDAMHATANEEYASMVHAQDIVLDAQAEAAACDCDESGDAGRNDYRYFNPSSNYSAEIALLEAGKESPISADEIREYVQQDYKRMEAYNNDQWAFIGIQAEAEITVDGVSQTVSSGGLWGIESDSEDSYFAEVGAEELNQVRTILHGLGFSKRAIATACKDVEKQTL